MPLFSQSVGHVTDQFLEIAAGELARAWVALQLSVGGAGRAELEAPAR